MKCVKCGKEIMEQDKCFMLRSIPFGENFPTIAICEDCAETVTPMELYMLGKIPMRNSDDDAIDTSAVVLDDIDEELLIDEKAEYLSADIARDIVKCDTREQFLVLHPGHEEEWDAEVEGK